MPVELRKRKAPAPAPAPPAKKQSKATKVATKVKEAVKGKPAKSAGANGASKPAKPVVGATITLEGFGGEIETNDGTKTTLKDLVDESKSGVVLFTYPKASTPGCTNQACLFRDSYEPLTSGGLAIYGLSTDSPKANTTFKTKQNLPYPLLCDQGATLIDAIGLKKAPKGTTRGVFAVDKAGKVLLAEPGGPAATVDAVKKLVGDSEGAETEEEEPEAEKKAEDAKAANGEADGREKSDES
ncbi:AhpC-TSA-domain-containing protein [Whalleya microplaca]|nr:AhpC-TSA-domain-containing protein [Whalleya microplaca]